MPIPRDQDRGQAAEVLGIEYEAGVQPAEDAPEPRWLPIAVVVFGVAALLLLLSLSPGEPSSDPETGADPAEVALPDQTEAPDRPASDAEGIDALDPGGEDSPRQQITSSGTEPVVPLWLIELSPDPSDEQAIRMVNLDGLAQEVEEPVFFESTRWPAWAGAPLRPFVTVETNIVFSSRGQIVVADLWTGDSSTIGAGTSVVDGAASGEFWVIGEGERQVTRYNIGDVTALEQYPFSGIGRPVAAVTNGLVVVPRLDQFAGKLAVWRPDIGLTSIDTDGLELLGAAGDVVVLGGDHRLVRYEITTGISTEVRLEESFDLHQVALSPDGQKLAMAQRHDVTSLGTLVIVDAVSGATLRVVDQVMDREFVWTSPETVVTVGFVGKRYQVLELDLRTERVRALATLRYPWIYLAPVAV